jgi:hypothetical protein
MMRCMRGFSLVAVVLLAFGCGGTNPGGGGGDDTVMDAPTGSADAYVPPTGFTRLIGRSWSLNAGDRDIYRCVRFTVPTDMYITEIEAQAPLGTHHTVLSIASGPAQGPDGEQNCSVQTLGMVMLYASGVGTSPLKFPTGVGVKVAAGTQQHLNLHLYNASDEGLSGESAIWVKSQPTEPPMLAEMVFAGPLQLTLPIQDTTPNGTPITGTCSINQSYKLFALWPHMHKLATHQKIELLRGQDQPVVLHDKDYDFEEQTYWLQDPEIQLQSGDKIRVTCMFKNTTGKQIMWGDSSDEEMCFGGMYRYPAQGSILFCAL